MGFAGTKRNQPTNLPTVYHTITRKRRNTPSSTPLWHRQPNEEHDRDRSLHGLSESVTPAALVEETHTPRFRRTNQHYPALAVPPNHPCRCCGCSGSCWCEQSVSPNHSFFMHLPSFSMRFLSQLSADRQAGSRPPLAIEIVGCNNGTTMTSLRLESTTFSTGMVYRSPNKRADIDLHR